jgi:hypothetical protein
MPTSPRDARALQLLGALILISAGLILAGRVLQP